MATNPKKTNETPDSITAGDPLLTLHYAQAEAELAKTTGGLGPTTNVYVTDMEEENIDEAIAPRDSQGFVRGESEPSVIGSNAGDHN